MGILDDAIREHLDLKRQHGAEESEVEGLEAEAFGPADRPDATDPPPTGDEAQTQVISPGSALTAPAGEGDQLDKVFEATREEEASAGEEASDAEPESQSAEGASADVAAEAPEESAVERPPPDPVAEAPAPPAIEREEDDGEGDAGDALERERQHLAGQPTEHYDVDAAIAEEDEIDLLSESSLSEELDRALEGPDDTAPAAEPEPEPEHELEPETAAAPEPEDVAEPVETDADTADPDQADEDTAIVTGEVVEEKATDPADAEFFDQDDPLEGTPDFLEETPEHDRLWFEQKEPKDFDFGD
jgi:hypothetical protein